MYVTGLTNVNLKPRGEGAARGTNMSIVQMYDEKNVGCDIPHCGCCMDDDNRATTMIVICKEDRGTKAKQ